MKRNDRRSKEGSSPRAARSARSTTLDDNRRARPPRFSGAAAQAVGGFRENRGRVLRTTLRHRRRLATAKVLERARFEARPHGREYRRSRFPGEIPAEPVLPEQFDGVSLELDGRGSVDASAGRGSALRVFGRADGGGHGQPQLISPVATLAPSSKATSRPRSGCRSRIAAFSASESFPLLASSCSNSAR
jgi:hypothetical protein